MAYRVRVSEIKAVHSSLIVTRNMPGGIAPSVVQTGSDSEGLQILKKWLAASSAV
jgi:hypothetical protein